MKNVFTKYLHSFLSQPVKLFWFYIMVNILPSILLIFTEPLNVPGKILLILFPSGVYFILFSSIKNTGLIQLMCIPLLILHAFQLVLFYLFGEDVIAVDMFLNVVTTNPSEAGELLSSIWPSVIFVCIIYIPTIIIAFYQFRKNIYFTGKYRRNTFVTGIILIVLSGGITLFSKNYNTENISYKQDIYPANIFYNLGFAIQKWEKSKAYPETSKDFTFEAVRETATPRQREIYVLVIGETSRAENWSLYGYERKTNPLLEKQQGLIYFEDAITQSNTTHKSVAIMLSAASAGNYSIIYQQKSIITAFREAGFTTVFLSNQGENNTFTQYFSEEADFYHNIRSGKDREQIVNKYDGELLELLNHYVNSSEGDLFIVLHTYGSHFNYRERYTDKFSVFEPDDVTEIRKKDKDKLINAYDNTILYTDYFLSQVISALENSKSCSAMLFASDHGEDLMDDKRMRFLHASPNPTFYQLKIPMLIWLSPSYMVNLPEKAEGVFQNKFKPVATDAIFHSLLDMASIKTQYFDINLSLLNPDFKIEKRMYLDDHDKPIFFYNANLKKEDKVMIGKRNMHH